MPTQNMGPSYRYVWVRKEANLIARIRVTLSVYLIRRAIVWTMDLERKRIHIFDKLDILLHDGYVCFVGVTKLTRSTAPSRFQTCGCNIVACAFRNAHKSRNQKSCWQRRQTVQGQIGSRWDCGNPVQSISDSQK